MKDDILVVVCQHGNEPFGLEVKEKLEQELDFIIANPKAIEKNVRYIETDMNRSFPGNPNGAHEEKLAHDLGPKLQKYKLIIDLHSSTSRIDLFGIITKPSKDIFNIADKMNLKQVVIMPEEFSKNQSLIDHARLGISLEVGPHLRKENADETIKAITSYINNVHTKNKAEIFEVFGTLKGTGTTTIKDFTLVKKGELIGTDEKGESIIAPYNFYPVLTGEQAYNNVLCLVSRKYTQ